MYFWTHKENIPEGKGYGQFTASHFIWIAVTILFTAAVSFLYKSFGPVQKLILLRTLSFTLIIIDIIKLIVIAVTKEVKVSDFLPLELCSFAGYSIFFDSLFPGNAFFPQLLVTLFMPAAIMAVVFPTTTPLPSFNFYSIHQFLYHGLIIAYVIARYANGEIICTYPGVWDSILKILILAAVIYFIDIRFKKNFMFLAGTDDNPMLEAIEKKTGPGFPYTLGLTAFSIAMIHVFFAFFKAIEILFIR